MTNKSSQITLRQHFSGEGHDALAVSMRESAIKWAKLVLRPPIISDRNHAGHGWN